jgi:ketosteroid isomerase-like protein
MTRMLLRWLPAVVVLACRPSAPASTGGAAPALISELARQLDRSADDWNRGNLDGFMSDYAHDSATTFVEGGHARHGWDYIRSRYAPRFAPGATRDSLRFEEVAARALGDRHALLTARFVLFRGGRTTASGPFTLVFERQANGWKILHDHTSSDPQ